MTAVLEGARVAVVGGGSGMGLAIAQLAGGFGAKLTIGGRSRERLDVAAASIEGARAQAVDVTDAASVQAFFEWAGEIDHLVVTASQARTGRLGELPLDAAELAMRSKFWGPYLCTRAARLRSGGSLTLFSGVLSRAPVPGSAALAGANAAVEAMGRALALELAPTRVNTISPGLVATGAYDGMAEEARTKFFADTAASLPVGRVGSPDDIAAAVLMLMTNAYVTGVTLDLDGGGLLVGTRRH